MKTKNFFHEMSLAVLSLGAAALLPFVSAGCSDDAPVVETIAADQSAVKIDEPQVEICSEGRYYTVTATANGLEKQVRVSTSAAWIELGADTLSSKGALRFYVKPNGEGGSRDAVINFSLGSSKLGGSCKVHQRSLAEDDDNSLPGGQLTRRSRVGYGYNMYIDYIDEKSVTEPILDYKKLVEAEQVWGTIIAQEGRSQQNLKVHSSYSIEEMAQWMTQQVTTEVKFLGFSEKIDKFKKVSDFSETQRTYGYSAMSKTIATRYIDEGKLESLVREGKDVFTADFRKMYDEVNKSPNNANIAAFVKKYGTHLVIYADLGGRLECMVNFRSEETSHETVEKYMKYKNGKQKANKEEMEQWHKIVTNGNLTCDIYGGTEAAANALRTSGTTTDPFSQLDVALLDGWLKSVSATDPSSVSLVSCVLQPIWQLFTNTTARNEVLSYIIQLARTEGGRLNERIEQLSFDNYYRFDITDKMEQWGSDVNSTLVRLAYYDNIPKVEICNEYVPELRGDRRVTIYYPIYKRMTNIRRGFFPGDGENPPAEVMFDGEGGCYVKPIEGYKAGQRLTTVYYIDGAFYPNNLGINIPTVRMELKEHRIDLKDGGPKNGYPVVKIGPGYWIRHNITGSLKFGSPVDPRDPECMEYDLYEENRNGMLFANIFYGNSLAYRRNYPGLFDADVDAMDNRIHWYVPRVKDIKALEQYVGKNTKALFANQQSGFEAQFAGYNGERDDLNGGKKVKMGMHYEGQYCFIASKEGVSNSGEALVLGADYTLRRVGITLDYDNWYPVRAYRSSYYKYK